MPINETVEPRTLVFPNKGKIVSLYSVCVYPFALAKRGARIAFFRAEIENEIVCYMYLPEDLSVDLKGDAYTQGIDQLCEIGKRALFEFGIDLGSQIFDVHVDVGELDLADFDEDEVFEDG